MQKEEKPDYNSTLRMRFGASLTENDHMFSLRNLEETSAKLYKLELERKATAKREMILGLVFFILCAVVAIVSSTVDFGL